MSYPETPSDNMLGCDCPTPCRRTMYDTSISYASSSQFDTTVFLNTENITDINHSYNEVW